MRFNVKRKCKKIHVDKLIYGLYKGDQFLYTGTIDEISTLTNLTMETVEYLLYPSYKQRVARRIASSKGSLYLVCLGLDDDAEADERFLNYDYMRKMRKKLSSYVSVS